MARRPGTQPLIDVVTGARPGTRASARALEALRRLPEAVFGVLMSLDPAVAALAGFVVLDQDLGARELLAIAMVVVASAGAAASVTDDDLAGKSPRT